MKKYNGKISLYLGLGALAIIMLSGLMAGVILIASWHSAKEAKQNVAVIKELQQLLTLANLVAAERAPSNILIGSNSSDQPLARLKLNSAREETDNALRLSSKYINGAHLFILKQNLKVSRFNVDNISNLKTISEKEAQNAITGMFLVSDILHDIIMMKASSWFERSSSLSTAILKAISLSELRDTAGRVGSWLIAPIQTSSPLNAYELQGIYRADEKIKLLWNFITPAGVIPVHDRDSAKTSSKAIQLYFNDGRPLIDMLITEGQSTSGIYSLTSLEFTERYRSTLSLLERWQFEYIINILMEYEQRESRYANLFLIVIVTITIIITIISCGFSLIQFRILRPLLTARKMIVDLAEERDFSVIPPGRVKELDLLFYSIKILKSRLKERRILTQRLQHLAETDALTGLSNRRAFDLKVSSWLSDSRRDYTIFLIIMDLDYFKRINDFHGHPDGDKVLICTADVIRSQVRQEDIAARLGGEEFAIVMRAKMVWEALAVAERIRTELRTKSIRASNGENISITSSFGIAGSSIDSNLEKIIAEADAALYEAKAKGRDRVEIFENT